MFIVLYTLYECAGASVLHVYQHQYVYFGIINISKFTLDLDSEPVKHVHSIRHALPRIMTHK